MMFRRNRHTNGSSKEYEASEEEDEPLRNIQIIVKGHGEFFRTPNIYISKIKRAKYKIVKDIEPIENVLSILDHWNISKPKLIVSVTGGAGMFALPSRIKTAFKYGIAKIAESTDALIITGIFRYLKFCFIQWLQKYIRILIMHF